MNWNHIIADISGFENSKLLQSWYWLVGEALDLILVSAIGDAFLRDKKGEIYWLDVGVGKLKKVASDIDEFNECVNNIKLSDEWFMFNLVNQINEKGLKLEPGKVFSYIKAPVVGGEYHVNNFDLTDIDVHFHFWGQVHEKIKDLPEGTKVNIVSMKNLSS